MNPLGLFSQISAAVIAITIGYFYVQPTVEQIGQIQTDIVVYQTERQEIESIIAQLDRKVAEYESISPANKTMLDTYMPTSIDDISIMRDLSFIIEQANLRSTALSYNGVTDGNATVLQRSANPNTVLADRSATPYSFTVSVNGEYAQIKDFLRILEQNEYPLDVYNMSLSADQFDRINSTMTLVSYIHEEQSLVTEN